MNKEVVYVFKDTVDFHIPDRSLDGTLARRALNKSHTGKETIPLKDEVPKALLDATYSLHRGVRKNVIVTVYSDGTYNLEFDNG